MSEDMNQINIKEFQVGDIIQGQVTKVEEKQVFLDIADCKLDGIIPISELSSIHVEKANDVVSLGDVLVVKVTKVEENALILSKRKMDAEKAWKDLQAKFESKEIFEAEVKDVVKGGLVVDIGVRGFVPASLVETFYVDNFEEYKGKTLTFKIVELDQTKNRVILSHRAVVEQMLTSNKQQLLKSIEVGQIIDGIVQRLTDFGAFVDIGGVDGLVHISQLAHTHVGKPSDVVQEGQKVTVKILGIDHDNERISLSLKETVPGPWTNISERIKTGDIVEGVVKRLVNFGAFVEISHGVEGLVHISHISNKHIATPHEVLKEGEKVQVKVLDVNEQMGRISLSIRDLEEVAPEEDYSEYRPSEETSGFQLGEMIGDQLNKLK